MAEIVRFEVGLPPASLSPNSRKHWRVRNADKQAYAEQVWIAGTRWQNERLSVVNPVVRRVVVRHPVTSYTGTSDYMPELYFWPWEWAAVHLIKHSTHQTDQDNIIASCKTLIDCLSTKGTRPLGIFEDDKRIAITAEWKRERVRAKGRIEVIVTRRAAP